MPTLLSIGITTAQSAQVGPVFQYREARDRDLCIQANFTYGSGGTTVDAWVQTTVDGGATWIDVCNFHFTTSSLRYVFNLSALTPVTTEYTATDGSLASNTAKDGIIGTKLRVKYTTVGTYAASTSLAIDVASTRMFNP